MVNAYRLRHSVLIAIASVVFLSFSASLPEAANAGKKFRSVPLSNMHLRHGADPGTTTVGGSIFRYAWFNSTTISETTPRLTVLEMNRTSCKSLSLSVAGKASFGDYGENIIEVISEGRPSREFSVIENSVRALPTAKVKLRSALIVRIKHYGASGGGRVFVNGSGKCKTRTGRF